MTKIPSVEERVAELGLCECEDLSGELQTDRITQALTADRTALLTELRDSGLLAEKEYVFDEGNKEHIEFETDLEYLETRGEAHEEGHNTLARAIKARINNLINPNV